MRAWRALLTAGSIVLVGACGSPQAGGTKSVSLLKGGIRTVCVQARLRWNHSGIRLDPAGKYLITAQGIWWDKDYRHGPGGGDSPNGTMSTFERFRRMKRENWFKLICALDSQQSTAFPVGCKRAVDKRSGELTCYANDVWLFYANNSGEIQMTVKRIE